MFNNNAKKKIILYKKQRNKQNKTKTKIANQGKTDRFHGNFWQLL